MKKIAIIGSGPSGLTAGIYTSRADIETTIFTGFQPGGQLTTTTELENFPGCWNQNEQAGLMGPDFMALIQNQAEHFGCNLVYDAVTKIKFNKIDIVLATHNPSKVARFEREITNPHINFVLGENLEILENGKNEEENAILKAKAHYQKTGKISLSLDTGLYFEGVLDSEQPKKNVQGIAGGGDFDSAEIRFEKMIKFYSDLATKYGGVLEGYFLDTFCIYDGKETHIVTGKRRIELTNILDKRDINFPISNLFRVKGIPYHDLSNEQMSEFNSKPYNPLREFLGSFVKNQISLFSLETGMSGNPEFDGIIVASGASAKWLGIEGEEQFVGNGYHSCATCDGFFYRGKEIIVVGGGDSAMEEANFLTKFATKVYLIHRSDKYRASKIMLERCQNNPKIEFMPFKAITKFVGNDKGKIESVEIQNTITKEVSTMQIGGVFVAIGHIPNSDFVGEILIKDEAGYLLTQNHLANRTSIYGNMSNFEGIFIAGDVEDKTYRQAITAAGDGCKAAMDLEKWLED